MDSTAAPHATGRDDLRTEGLIDALSDFGRTQRAFADQISRELGWSRASLSLLRWLSCSGPVPLSDVAAAQQVDLSVVSRQVSALTEAGYVARSVDPVDRRVRTVEITETGRDLIAHRSVCFVRATERVFGTWSDDELLAAITQLRRLTEAISTVYDDTPHERSRKELTRE